MSEYQPIEFHSTITGNKRKGAYVRKNLMQSEDGRLVPLIDFNEIYFAGVDSIIGNANFLYRDYIFVKNDTTGNYEVWRYVSGYSATLIGTTANKVVSASDDFDGIKVLTSDGELYSIVNTTITLIDDLSGTDYDAKITFDGVNHFVYFNNDVYRQVGNTTFGTSIFSFFGDLKSVEGDENYQILFIKSYSGVQACFWDKASSTDFSKIVEVKNTVFGASGLVDGKLILAHSIGNTTNSKEKMGEMKISIFNGERFKKVVSFKTGDKDVNVKDFSSGNGVLIFSLADGSDSHNTELFRDWLVKFNVKNNALEFLSDPNELRAGREVDKISVGYNYQNILINDSGKVYLFVNNDDGDNYDNYDSYKNASYTTEFFQDPSMIYSGEAFEVTIEKPFEQLSESKNVGEYLEIYYRTSERDGFTLLKQITVKDLKDVEADLYNQEKKDDEYYDDNKGLSIQEFTFKLNDELKPFPRWNELQLGFKLFNGATVLRAGYWYNRIKRKSYE